MKEYIKAVPLHVGGYKIVLCLNMRRNRLSLRVKRNHDKRLWHFVWVYPTMLGRIIGRRGK